MTSGAEGHGTLNATFTGFVVPAARRLPHLMWRRGYVWECQSLPGFIVGIMFFYFYFSMCFTIPKCSLVFSANWTAAMYALSIFNTLMTVTAYVLAVKLDPGPVPAKWHQDTEDQAPSVPLCVHCNEYKPHRTHHCSHCKRCVLRYDHHCDWIDNCVGHANHKFFFLFQFYISSAIIHHFYLLVIMTTHDLHLTSSGVSHWAWCVHVFHIAGLAIYTMVIIPLSCFGVMFSFWTAYLIVNNQTSLEQETGHTFDQGFVKNLQEVMGVRPWVWFLPTQVEINVPKLEARRWADV